jgi:hypothetical protein
MKIQSFQNVGRIPNLGWSLAGDGRLPGNTSICTDRNTWPSATVAMQGAQVHKRLYVRAMPPSQTTVSIGRARKATS